MCPFISVPSMKDLRLQVTVVRIDERCRQARTRADQNEDVQVDMGK
jgi:hypothetical protein